MKFTKMQGAGNDFIIINNIEETLPHDLLGPLAKRLCARRLSIGADGLMVVESPEQEGDCRMLFYNADGTPGEMCGNGARCMARYAYEKGLAGEIQRIETPAGLVTGRRISRRQYRVRLNDPSVVTLDMELYVVPEGGEHKALCLCYAELGDPGIPHAVVEIPDLVEADRSALFRLGRALCHHPAFPKGANITFYQPTGAGRVRELTYERGVEDFTMACGTGTGALATVLALKNQIDGRLEATMPGGTLCIDVTITPEGRATDIFLTGPTNIVAEGEVLDEDLNL